MLPPRVVAQLVAAGKEVLDEADDALLLIHLRKCLAVVRLLVALAEHLAYQVGAQLLEAQVPTGADRAGLFLQAGLLAIARQSHQTGFGIVGLVVEGLVEAGVLLHLEPFTLFLLVAKVQKTSGFCKRMGYYCCWRPTFQRRKCLAAVA